MEAKTGERFRDNSKDTRYRGLLSGGQKNSGDIDIEVSNRFLGDTGRRRIGGFCLPPDNGYLLLLIPRLKRSIFCEPRPEHTSAFFLLPN